MIRSLNRRCRCVADPAPRPISCRAAGSRGRGDGQRLHDGLRGGFTGGGNGTHQVYISGLTDHRLKDADIVDHLVELVEKKAAEIEAAKRSEKETGLAAAQ